MSQITHRAGTIISVRDHVDWTSLLACRRSVTKLTNN
jgi:hypothetical protein